MSELRPSRQKSEFDPTPLKTSLEITIERLTKLASKVIKINHIGVIG